MALLVTACSGSDALLGVDAEQGIDGLVLRGPLCPVSSPDDPCPDQPYQAAIDVLDADGHRLTTVESGADGRFRVGLVPGRYTLHPHPGDPVPIASDQAVQVEAGVWVEVTVSYDTGIR